MADLSDRQLLEQFCTARDRSALDTLVRRHIDLVYAAARRQVRDAHLAEDITQAVFIVLARKAHTVRTESVVPWLYSVTRHAANNARRMVIRRQTHETKKAVMYQEETPAEPLFDAELRDSLDDAIGQLSGIDRDTVVLHYLNNLPHKQVGAILGLTEEAARKRVTRAVAKLRGILARRGIGASAAGISAAAQVHAPAPAALIESTINVSFLSVSSTAAAGTSMTIAKGVFNMFTLAKIKVAALVALGVSGLSLAALPIVGAMRSDLPVVQTTVAFNATNALADGKTFETKVTDDIKVEFLGVAPFEGDENSWRDLAGAPIDPPSLPGANRVMAQPPPEHQLVVKITKPKDVVARLTLPNSSVNAVMQQRENDGEVSISYLLNAFSLEGGGNEAQLRVGIATEAWQDIGELATLQDGGVIESKDAGTLHLGGLTEEEGRATVPVTTETNVNAPEDDLLNQHIRIVAVDDKGEQHECTHINVNSDGQTIVTHHGFDLPQDQVRKFVAQSKKFNKIVEVSGISLEAGHISEPKIEVKDLK